MSTPCATCGQPFVRRYNISARRKPKSLYCSIACAQIGRRKWTHERAVLRFWAKVQAGNADECWEWQAQRDGRGYGRFGYRGPRSVFAHRFAFEITTGREAGDLSVCHTCDNPPCCNPAHLWLGSHQENMLDCVQKGRARRNPRLGEKHQNSKLTTEQVLEAFRSPLSAAQLANQLGVNASTITRIRRGQAWSHVTGQTFTAWRDYERAA